MLDDTKLLLFLDIPVFVMKNHNPWIEKLSR